MPQILEAEVALIHVAGEAPRTTPPPGTVAQTAPRRSARGRRNDVLFLSLSLGGSEHTSTGLLDHLAARAAEAFFGTPGSITSALREAVSEVNVGLLDFNRDSTLQSPAYINLLAGVLRGNNLFLAQCGDGQMVLIRPGQVTRLTSEEASRKPLGMQHTPFIRYHHLEVNQDDIVILSAWEPPIWSDPSLSGLAGLTPSLAVDRLSAASPHDLSGILFRLTSVGSPHRPKVKEEVTVMPEEEPSPVVMPSFPAFRRGAHREPVSSEPSQLRLALAGFADRLRAGMQSFGEGVAKFAYRLAPGLVEPPRPGLLPPALLATTAVVVPIVIVALSGMVYLRKGKTGQFQEYLTQARTAMVIAQNKSDGEEARYDWLLAMQWLTLAESYGDSLESQELHQEIQNALDELDLVIRLDFSPAVSGGFGPGAQVTALEASTSDLYVLDAANQIIWHTWATGRGYEVDSDFQCLGGIDSIPGMGNPVGMALQSAPGALGAEGILALDADGTLLYCAPGHQPASGQIFPPDIGWGRIQAMDARGDEMYILDPEANQIWIYESTKGLFGGSPSLYFVDQIMDLSTATDVVKSQDELFILHTDGRLDRCQRFVEAAQGGGIRIRVECDPELVFRDERPGKQDMDHIPGAVPSQLIHSPPPEPSIFILDNAAGSVYHYSMRLVYQGQYKPSQDLEEPPLAIAFGSPNTLFLAVADQVYYAQLTR